MHGAFFYRNIMRMLADGDIVLRRFDDSYYEFSIEYKGHIEIIRFTDWQLEEIFPHGIPINYEEFRKNIIMYIEGEIRRKEEEQKRSEENKELANELLNTIRPYVEEFARKRGLRIDEMKAEGGATWGGVKIFFISDS
jgi:hypothetical protein